MTRPDVVPSKITSPLNYRILGGIIIAVVSFHIFINYVVKPDDSGVIISIISFINPLVVSIAGFVVAYRYRDSKIFGKAYLTIALAYFSIFLGEIIYLGYDIFLGIDPYPSIADLFFFVQYPLLLIHLVLNTRFFTPSFGKIAKTWLVALPLFLLLTYSGLSFIAMDGIILDFDFYYGAIFVTASAATLAFAVLGASIFREGVLGKAWLLLVFGILFNTIGDTWYYYLELFGQYDLQHIVNLFWYAGYWIVIYALYKHNKTI